MKTTTLCVLVVLALSGCTQAPINNTTPAPTTNPTITPVATETPPPINNTTTPTPTETCHSEPQPEPTAEPGRAHWSIEFDFVPGEESINWTATIRAKNDTNPIHPEGKGWLNLTIGSRTTWRDVNKTTMHNGEQVVVVDLGRARVAEDWAEGTYRAPDGQIIDVVYP